MRWVILCTSVKPQTLTVHITPTLVVTVTMAMIAIMISRIIFPIPIIFISLTRVWGLIADDKQKILISNSSTLCILSLRPSKGRQMPPRAILWFSWMTVTVIGGL